MSFPAARAGRLLTAALILWPGWQHAQAAPGGMDGKPQTRPVAPLRSGLPARQLPPQPNRAKPPHSPEPRSLTRVSGAVRPAPRPAPAAAPPPTSPPRPERPPAARASIDSRIAAARDAYQAGRYAEVPTALVKLLSESPLSPPQLAAVYELLASAYVALGQTELAIRCFSEVLNRRPAFALDPVRTSPKIRAALDRAKDLARSPAASPQATTPAAHKPL